MKDFSFYLITDPHYYSKKLGAYGKDYEDFMDFEQKCYAETPYINDAVLDFLGSQKEIGTILIAGDLSFNGEKESHIEYSQKLKELKATGKNIYVVTAGHDISEDPFQYNGGERESAEGISFGDLPDYYWEFGYENAVALNREHLSYVADLNDEIRLLVLCNDTAEDHNVEYDGNFLGWIEAQAKKAQADGKMMIAMEHYPVLAGQPLLELIPDARQKGAKKLVETLADNGVHLIFTGHMHNQSINVTTTEKGNKFYDVCTGSLIGCPAYMRKITVKNASTVEIESIPVPDFQYDTKGKSCTQYLQDQFDRMILTVILSMKDDTERFMGKFGLKEKTSLYKPVKIIGKALATWKTGRITKLFFVKCHKDVKDVLFLDILVQIVRNMFAGDQPFTEDTPVGSTFLQILKRLSPIFKILNKKLHGSQGESVDLYEMLKHSAGNYGISDHNAVIEW